MFMILVKEKLRTERDMRAEIKNFKGCHVEKSRALLDAAPESRLGAME